MFLIELINDELAFYNLFEVLFFKQSSEKVKDRYKRHNYG